MPDVPITRANPLFATAPAYGSMALVIVRTSRRSSRSVKGSLFTSRSVSRMTPILKLFDIRKRSAVPSVISTLPPPMSMTTAERAPTLTPYMAAR